MAASNQSKITLLYLVYPGMGGLMCDLHAVPRGSQPFHEDAMDKRLCRPPWKPQTDGTIDSWLDGLRDRLSRLYLSVGLVEPKDKPMWCSGKPWGDCVKELVARASHTVVVTQPQDNYIYDRLKQGQEPTAFPWRELDSLAQSVQGLHIDRDAFGTKKGVEAMMRATGFRVRQMRPIARTDRTILTKVGQAKARMETAEKIVSPDALKPSEAHIRRREIITNLPGTDGDKRTIGFVVPYFNACGFESKLRNVEKFLDHYKWMEDRMLVVELAYGEQDFSLTGKTANLLQLRADSVMWHKENLMNLGTRVLRDRGYQDVGYLDADLIVDGGEAWYQKLSQGMGTHNYMQVFENIVHSFSDRSQAGAGAAANYITHKTALPKCYKNGGGWVVRGGIWDRCGWYDKCIVGAGDQAMFLATFSTNPILPGNQNVKSSVGHLSDYLQWATRWHGAIKRNVGYPRGSDAVALPHGAGQNRQYASRETGLLSSGYDPLIHIRGNDCGVLEWSAQATEAFTEWVWLYFRGRQEDGRRTKIGMPVKPHMAVKEFNISVPMGKSGNVDIPTGRAVGFVAPYFNYLGYNSLRKNYMEFLRRFEWLGDRLLPVELVFHDRKPEFDYPGMMHVHSDSCLWHKERLVNIGCRELRKRGFGSVGYLDGDIGLLTPEDEWLDGVVSMTGEYKAVQAFETIDHIFADQVVSKMGAVAEHFIEGKPIQQCGIAGGAWVLDGGLFDAHGFFEDNVAGGGDTYLMLAALADIDDVCRNRSYYMGEKMRSHYKKWGVAFKGAVGGSVSYVDGTHVFCAPHGSRECRNVNGRKGMLKTFDPVRHIGENGDGCAEWTSRAPTEIKTMALEYFINRKEDD